MNTVVRGRFAPSPTGRMHAGNIFSALVMWLETKTHGGDIVLRIEDLDRERSKPEYIGQIQRDFELLGLTWDKGPYYQSSRDDVYEEVFALLREQELVYPCYCTRADLKAASAPHFGEKTVYPGTCRNLSIAERLLLEQQGRRPAWRLITPDQSINFEDSFQGVYSQNLAKECGDFIIRRSDDLFAYQLAVVIDDLEQGISTIVRGVDLINSTPQQIFLRRLLIKNGFAEQNPDPAFGHVPLLIGPDGRRLSKRHADANLDNLLATYKYPEAILGHIAYITGISETEEPAKPQDLLTIYNSLSMKSIWQNRISIPWS